MSNLQYDILALCTTSSIQRQSCPIVVQMRDPRAHRRVDHWLDTENHSWLHSTRDRFGISVVRDIGAGMEAGRNSMTRVCPYRSEAMGLNNVVDLVADGLEGNSRCADGNRFV